jgi:hypothetical protein
VPGQDLVRVGADLGRHRLAQLEVGVLGVRPGPGQLALHRLEHAVERPEQALVPVELDHVLEPEAALELVQAGPRHVGAEVEQLRPQ